MYRNAEDVYYIKDKIMIEGSDIYYDLDEHEINLFMAFANYTRMLNDLEGFYRIYRINLELMEERMMLCTNDEVITLCDEKEDILLLLNAMAINLFGSGKTLIEILEMMSSDLLKITDTRLPNFKKEKISKVYDTSYSYRIALSLRNYSQHGNLPITRTEEGRYCVELNRIKIAPHFKMKKKLEEEHEKIIMDIYEKYGQEPRMSLCKIMNDFNYCIHYLYKEFITFAENVYYELIEDMEAVLYNKRREAEIKNIIFKDNEGGYHGMSLQRGALSKQYDRIKDKAIVDFGVIKSSYMDYVDNITYDVASSSKPLYKIFE